MAEKWRRIAENRDGDQLARSSHADRLAALDAFAAELQKPATTLEQIDAVVATLAADRGCDSLGIGIDLLARLGPRVVAYARFLRDRDAREGQTYARGPHGIGHDVWYMVLGALPDVGVSEAETLAWIHFFSTRDSPALRDAALSALAGCAPTPAARRLLDAWIDRESDAAVRKAAVIARADWNQGV